jgi:hypothetical protein
MVRANDHPPFGEEIAEGDERAEAEYGVRVGVNGSASYPWAAADGLTARFTGKGYLIEGRTTIHGQPERLGVKARQQGAKAGLEARF